MRVLIIGSGPNAVEAKDLDKGLFDAIVVINNAWRVRSDWTYLIHPEDFPEDRRPVEIEPSQKIITAADYVPVQNSLGGFLYAGGTMAFTAGYWVLGALRPDVMYFIGCDMVYPSSGHTHFYGTGEADPLRKDITLQSLEAKSARLCFLAAERGCACVNLSRVDKSRLVFQRGEAGADFEFLSPDFSNCAEAMAAEEDLGYLAASGRYWLEEDKYDAAALSAIDALWLRAWSRHGER